jgi:Protein of unknown function (DUF3644)
MPAARWRGMVKASQQEALLAVDLYNRRGNDRLLEAFFVHMHIAWLYLLHAEFIRSGRDYRYWGTDGRLIRADGEPKTWELQKCVESRWSDQNDPVRRNLERTVMIRNKIEHRWQGALTVATGGYAQALVLNYESELLSAFGPKFSLADELRFPLFLSAFTDEGVARMIAAQRSLPPRLRKLMTDFDTDLDDSVRYDQRYEFRVHLLPRTGPKADADVSMSFVREENLSDEERKALAVLGQTGTVVVRERTRRVVNAGLLRPAEVARAVEARLPFRFGLYSHFPPMWRILDARPPGGSDHPERTREDYCIYDSGHGDYLYTTTFVNRVVSLLDTEDKWRGVFGRDPQRK